MQRSIAPLIIVVSVAFAWTVPRAHAQEETPTEEVDPTAEARALFERGIALTNEERWGEALEYFRRSRAQVDRPSTAFNMAVALLHLGRPTEGLSTLDEYLRASEDDPREVARREEARELLELALRSIAKLTLTIDPPSALVRIDGVLHGGEGATRELQIDPGTHSVSVGADGYTSSTFELSALDGELLAREVRLEEVVRPARLRVTTGIDAARILVDGAEVGQGAWMGDLEPGEHRIEVRADGHETFRKTVALSRAERLDVRASLVPRGSGTWIESPWLWIVGSVLVVGAGVGVGVALATSGSASPYGGSTGVVLEGLRY
jgi:hypothetical protein